MDILSINVDDNITQILLNFFDVILKHIHPNIITISGLILNYFIYIYLNNQKNNKLTNLQFIICMFFRWLSDCMDGAIARKYNKGSKLGHYLDTLSDVIIAFVFLYFILKKIFNLSFNTVLIIFLICLYIFNSKTNFIYSHDKMKNKNNNNNIFNKIIGFLTNNSYLYFILIIILQNTYLA
tara:strand:- start:716 stop:1258 length:543 start_codon:yes stop_codon:yes gene_type:complete